MPRKYKITIEQSLFCVYQKRWLFWELKETAGTYRSAMKKLAALEFNKTGTFNELLEQSGYTEFNPKDYE